MEKLLIPTHLSELYAEYELYCGVTKVDKVAYFNGWYTASQLFIYNAKNIRFEHF